MYSILKHLFSFILPLTVLVIVPFAIESKFTISVAIEFLIGTLFATVGIVILAVTASDLRRFGKGTIAPWNPTRKLVVNGLYLYVRNPMITGVLTALLGESLIFHAISIFVWLIMFFVINNIYFVLSEEPGLVKRFGAEYLEYKRNVPRWIPRLKPWDGNEKDASR
jgi:protein-S-isoprenylcysteine O-methyltransferase Ste14